MIQHYLKIATRNLLKYKTQSVISILGLAIGFAFCTFGYHWLRFETSYDGFYPESEYTYKVYGIDKQSGKKMERLPLILARKLKKDFPEVKDVTLIYPNFGSQFKWNEKMIGSVEECFIENNFFNFFPPEVLCGRTENILRSTDEVAIRESFARKHIGTPEEALGKVLSNGYRTALTVVAVLKDAPANTLFNEEAYELDYFTHRSEGRTPEDRQWKNNDVQIFIQLNQKASISTLKKKLYNYAIEQGHNKTFFIDIVPITGVRHTLASDLSFNLTYIKTFAIAGLLLLFCVFFNFINLQANRIFQRNREIKLRNAIGAELKSVTFLIEIELGLQLLIAFVLCFCILESGGSTFASLFETEINRKVLLAEFGVIAIGGWIFLTLISIVPVQRFIKLSFRNSSGSVMQANWQGMFRKISIGLQLTICIFFLSSASMLYRQVSLMNNKDLGFNKDGLIQLTMKASNRSAILRDISQLPLTKDLIRTSVFTIEQEPRLENLVEWEDKKPDYNPSFKLIEVSSNFLEGFGVKLKEGRFISPEEIGESEIKQTSNTCVLNEEAVRVMGLKDPIGKKIRAFAGWTSSDGVQAMNELEIIGVVKNFHSASLRNPVTPAIIQGNESWMGYYNYIRVTPGNEAKMIAEIQKIGKKHAVEGDTPNDIIVVNDLIDNLNKSENASLRLFSLLAVLCILISVFGIYSISSSNMEQRKKEIAVRKVLGASVGEIIRMFFKEYTWLVLIANIISFPLSYLFMSRWLEQYPYRIHITVWLYLLIFITTSTLVILTVLQQVLRAAGRNPAEVVKSE